MSSTLNPNINIALDATACPQGGGMPPEALVSAQSLAQNDNHHWDRAIDWMLGWKGDPSQFDDEDRPDESILDSALDYAYDAKLSGQPVPDSIVPSGSGRITMEWNSGPVTTLVEFISTGQAEMVEIHNAKVIRRSPLLRDPLTRKLEIRG